MENKYSVKELVEVISSMSNLDRTIVCLILGGTLSDEAVRLTRECIALPAMISGSQKPDLIHAIANWNLNYPAHKDDAILLLLEELLEDVKCQQQPGNQVEAETPR